MLGVAWSESCCSCPQGRGGQAAIIISQDTGTMEPQRVGEALKHANA